MTRHKVLQIVIFLILTNGAYTQVPKVSDGTIKHFENFSSEYVKARNVDVWLPPGYNNEQKYPVLYMHDGMALFDSGITWNHQEWGVDETITSLLQQEIIKPCIVAGIWNSGVMRQSEYFPQKVFENLTESQQKLYYSAELFDTGLPLLGGKVSSDNYLKFIVKELKPFIDSTFSVYKNSENTYIAGSSYGGLISIYGICEYPDIFSKAVCMSTHWPGLTEKNTFIPEAINSYLKENLPDPSSHKIYFDYGTTGLDSMYKPYQQQVDKIMVAKGYTPKNWISKEFVGATHEEKDWSKRLYIPITFILNKKD